MSTLGRTNGAARVAAALAPAEAAPRARCLCRGDVRNSGEGPARPRRCAEACRLQRHAELRGHIYIRQYTINGRTVSSVGLGHGG
jgi:hypothetical protein